MPYGYVTRWRTGRQVCILACGHGESRQTAAIEKASIVEAYGRVYVQALLPSRPLSTKLGFLGIQALHQVPLGRDRGNSARRYPLALAWARAGPLKN